MQCYFRNLIKSILICLTVLFLSSETFAFKLELKISKGTAASEAICTCDDGETNTVKAAVPATGPQHLNLMKACELWCKDHELADYDNRLSTQMGIAADEIKKIPNALKYCTGPGAFVDSPPPSIDSNTLRWELNTILNQIQGQTAQAAQAQKWVNDYRPFEKDLEYAHGKARFVLPKIVLASRIDAHPIYYSGISQKLYSHISGNMEPAQKLLSGLKVITNVKPVPNESLNTAQKNLATDLNLATQERGAIGNYMANWCKTFVVTSVQQLNSLIASGKCAPVNELRKYIIKLQADIAFAEKTLKDFPKLGAQAQRDAVSTLIVNAKKEISELNKAIGSVSCPKVASSPTPTPTPTSPPTYALTVVKPSGSVPAMGINNVRITGSYYTQHIHCGNAADSSQSDCTMSGIIPAFAKNLVLTADLKSNILMGQWTGCTSSTSTPPYTCTVNVDANKQVSLTYTFKVPPTGTTGTTTGTSTGTTTTVAKLIIEKPKGPMDDGTPANNVYILHNWLAGAKCGTAPTQNGCVIQSIPVVGFNNSVNKVTLMANFGSNVKMDTWTGDCSGNATTCQLNMTGDKKVGLKFVKKPTLTISPPSGPPVDGIGDNNVYITSPIGTNFKCGNAPGKTQNHCIFPGLTGTYTLNAEFGNNLVIAQWSGCATSTPTTCTVDMTADKNVALTFIKKPKLTIDKPSGPAVDGIGPNNVSIHQNCTDTNCGNAPGSAQNGCDIPSVSAPSCELIATIGENLLFQQWTGDCAGPGTTNAPKNWGRCLVTMGGDKKVGLTFIKKPKLTIDKPSGPAVDGIGPNNVSIHQNCTGTDCGNAPGSAQSGCDIPSVSSSDCELVATIGENLLFQQWTGDCAGPGTTNAQKNWGRCLVPMGGDRKVGLTYVKKAKLTISKPSGPGDGTGDDKALISGNGNGGSFYCGKATDQNDCTANLLPGTIRLNAFLGPNVKVKEWTGTACNGHYGQICNVPMNGDQNVGLIFIKDPMVQVNKDFNAAIAELTLREAGYVAAEKAYKSINKSNCVEKAYAAQEKLVIDEQKLQVPAIATAKTLAEGSYCNGTSSIALCAGLKTKLSAARTNNAWLLTYISEINKFEVECAVKRAMAAVNSNVTSSSTSTSTSSSSDPDSVGADVSDDNCAGWCNYLGEDYKCSRCLSTQFICMSKKHSNEADHGRSGVCGRITNSWSFSYGWPKCCSKADFATAMGKQVCNPSCPAGQTCKKRLIFGTKCEDLSCSASCAEGELCKKKGWYKKQPPASGWVYLFSDSCLTLQKYNEIVSSTYSATYQTTTPAGYNSDGTVAATPAPKCPPHNPPAGQTKGVMHSHDAQCGSCHVKGSSTVCATKTSFCDN